MCPFRLQFLIDVLGRFVDSSQKMKNFFQKVVDIYIRLWYIYYSKSITVYKTPNLKGVTYELQPL